MKGIYMYLIKKIVAGVITFGLIGTVISLFGNHKIVRPKFNNQPRTSQIATNSSNHSTNSNNKSTNSSNQSTNNSTDFSNYVFKNGDPAYVTVNNDVPTDLTPKDFSNPYIDYQNLDNLNRSRGATAYLTKANLGSDAGGRKAQTFEPTGYHNQPKIINGKRVFPVNRGHLIAYTVTFNLDNEGRYTPGAGGSYNNPKNLFTQTAFSNQRIMQITEQMVRDNLKENKKVIYKAIPIYDGTNLMAKGLWVEAETSDGQPLFNRYLYNVQPEIEFNYATGYSTINHSFATNLANAS